MPRTCVHDLDVIRLTRPIEGWPRGTQGTVVSEHRDYLVVEVGDEMEFIDVPRDALAVVERMKPAQR